MFKLITLLVVIGLSGCTQGQRFALKLNAELDQCAMKRMSETKFNSQQGYLQAHSECHYIVNVQKFHALNFVNYEDTETSPRKDALEEEYEFCWELVKGLVIDKMYPDLRLPQRHGPYSLTDLESHHELVARNSKVYVLPNKLSELNKEKLLMVRDTMQSDPSIERIKRRTLCSPWKYNELEEVIGREIHRRYPNGVG